MTWLIDLQAAIEHGVTLATWLSSLRQDGVAIMEYLWVIELNGMGKGIVKFNKGSFKECLGKAKGPVKTKTNVLVTVFEKKVWV